MEDFYSLLFAVTLAFVVAFLILRAFWLWYWRIGEIVALLKSIDQKLSTGSEKQPEEPPVIREKDGIRLSRRVP